MSWSGGRQLWFRAARAGDSVTLTLPSVPAGQYDLGAVLTRAGDYGMLRFAVDGVAVGQLFDGYAGTVQRTGAVPLGSASLATGTHRLTVTVTGRVRALDRLLRRAGHGDAAPRRPAGGGHHHAVRDGRRDTGAGRVDPRLRPERRGVDDLVLQRPHDRAATSRPALWHLFGITHAEAGAPQDEKVFGHATAPTPDRPVDETAGGADRRPGGGGAVDLGAARRSTTTASTTCSTPAGSPDYARVPHAPGHLDRPVHLDPQLRPTRCSPTGGRAATRW